MDNYETDDASLSAKCPRCGHVEPDDFEGLSPAALHEVRCEGCGVPFHCMLLDCASCAADGLFAWLHRPPEAAALDLTCPACFHRYLDHEDTAVGSELCA
jgi:DNA-directed RNA polymerase subunit RPC12/RpoP